jgi:SAM-dependent methyltransferase
VDKGLHEAARGFERSVADYERGRPGYPREAVDFLADRLGLGRGETVLDLAAGTGKLTRELVRLGADVVAVEPLDAMRAALPEDLHALDGTAESIPLPDESVDAVTVAQAFHWFDGDAALAEIHRVLRPDGGLGLIWNRRDDASPLHAEITRIIEPHRGGAPSHSSFTWKEAFGRTALFASLDEKHFSFEQVTDADGLVARVASISFVSGLGQAERRRVLDEVRSLAAGNEPVVLRYRTDVFWTYAMSR